MISKEDMILTRKFLHRMFKRALRVQNMHITEMAYIDGYDIMSKIY